MSARLLASFVFLTTLVESAAARADDEIDICIRSSKEGQLLRDSERLLDAKRSLDRCAQASCPRVIAQDCMRWRGEIESRIPGIVTTVQVGDRPVIDATVTVDKKQVLRPGERAAVDPGTHTVEVSTLSGLHQAQTVEVRAEETKRLSMQLATATLQEAPTPTPGVGKASVALWILGGASLLTAGVVGAYGYQVWQDLYDRCEPGRCFAADAKRADAAFLATDVLWISGLAAVGVGTLVYLLQNRTGAHSAGPPHAWVR